MLVWEPSGYLMFYKRLERGRFHLPTAPRLGARQVEIEATELGLIMEGTCAARGADRAGRRRKI